mgnify:CR=1 FL=1
MWKDFDKRQGGILMRKKVLGFITMFVMAFGICFVLPRDEASAAGNIESAVQWAINKANDNSCGYSQAANLRWGTSYYDCSSFVITALKQGGFGAMKARPSFFAFQARPL